MAVVREAEGAGNGVRVRDLYPGDSSWYEYERDIIGRGKEKL